MHWRIGALVVAMAIALACAAAVLTPPEYVATGGVLLPEGMLKVRFAAPDPYTAAALVRSFVEKHANPLLVDPPVILPSRPADETHLALAAVGRCSSACSRYGARRAPVARSEDELVAELGEPLLAARPLEPQELSRLLLEHWFGRGRGVLAVVSAESGKGHARVAAELARAFARDGRAHAPHRRRPARAEAPPRLGAAQPRRPGRLPRGRAHPAAAQREEPLGDGRRTHARRSARAAQPATHAGAAGGGGEALSRGADGHAGGRARPRPAALRRLRGRALVVASFSTRKSALARLRELLSFSKARVVGTVLSPA